jgi:PAS domain S-box-containing protein
VDVWHERVRLVSERDGLIFETIYRRKDGTSFPTEVSARMLDYEGDTVMIAIVRDISERKLAEKTLQESDARLRMILESAIDAFISMDSSGDILEWNSQAAQIFGWSRGEAVGRNLADLIIPESHRESHRFGLKHFLETGEGPVLNRRIEITGLHRNGLTFPVELAVISIPAREGVTFSAFVRDITLKKQLERERESLIDELELRSSESETLRESLASIAGRLEFSEIIEDILDQVKRVVPYDTASVWRIEGNLQKFITGRNVPAEITTEGYGFEIEPENSAYPILNGDVPYIMKLDVQGQLKDFQMHPHTYVQSWLAIPLKRRGQVVGLIALDGMQKNQFTGHHAELAVTFANQVSIALENSRLFAELQAELKERKQVEVSLRQRESILEVVAEAGNLLLKSSDWTLEIDSILGKLGPTINATHAYIFENHIDENGIPVFSMRFEWTAPGFSSDLGDPKFQNVPLLEPDFISWYEMLKVGQPYIGDQFHLNPEDMDFILERGMNAILDVPIFVDGAWWGTIGFDDMAVTREWTSAEIDALLVAGNILGAAIQRQRADVVLQEELSQRRLLIEELESKNAELERFTYTVSHDLKSPLFTIRGFIGYLEQDLVSGDLERFRRDTQRIIEATDKMQQLLNDLLELSRVGRLMNEPRKIQMNDLIRDVLDLVQGQIRESGVEVEVQPNLPDVFGDQNRIAEVVQNLVDNAVKFMGDQPGPRIEIGQAGIENHMPIFFVRDNGTGIRQEHFERIFGLFNKLDPQSTGTGIGLALVKRIIEFHGGRIWVESEAGMGSTFCFTLPAQAQAAVPGAGESVKGI